MGLFGATRWVTRGLVEATFDSFGAAAFIVFFDSFFKGLEGAVFTGGVFLVTTVFTVFLGVTVFPAFEVGFALGAALTIFVAFFGAAFFGAAFLGEAFFATTFFKADFLAFAGAAFVPFLGTAFTAFLAFGVAFVTFFGAAFFTAGFGFCFTGLLAAVLATFLGAGLATFLAGLAAFFGADFFAMTVPVLGISREYTWFCASIGRTFEG
ncbi:MAG: hypothetical protein KDC00_06330 [Flavobacteriales bacterium]|nr:hypothetical protein [Flavobacteriales bacterium]